MIQISTFKEDLLNSKFTQREYSDKNYYVFEVYNRRKQITEYLQLTSWDSQGTRIKVFKVDIGKGTYIEGIGIRGLISRILQLTSLDSFKLYSFSKKDFSSFDNCVETLAVMKELVE